VPGSAAVSSGPAPSIDSAGEDRLSWRRQAIELAPGFIVVALMIVWAVRNGGYDTDTWYWGALVLLVAAGAVLIGLGSRLSLSRTSAIALGAFACYVAWSYLSMAWAQYPGDALEGSNRALLYLLAFGLMLALPWTPEAALIALLAFVIGIGVLEIVILARLASADHVARLVIGGRLAAPTGYYNSTAALFMIEALVATTLATMRRLPSLLQGLLIAFACAGLQLALIVQSRGWLFTLPIVLVVAIVLVPDRLRVVGAFLLPVLAVLAPLRPLLHVFQLTPGPALNHGASHAGKDALVVCAAMFVAGALLARGEKVVRPRALGRRTRRAVGSALAVGAVVAACAAGVVATHGHPFHFIAREWKGIGKEETSFSSGSHFIDIGSGRYDVWRVSLDAFASHPLGGIGQDNFADYYITHRHTDLEPAWTHSLELRLLVHTGIVGFLLFAVFFVCALRAALRSRRRGTPLTRIVAAAALLPLVVWTIHGSIDWFWEVPALSGPALGFLGMAGALSAPGRTSAAGTSELLGRSPLSRILLPAALALAFLAALAVLAIPYLSVREVSIGTNAAGRNPTAALRDLDLASKLNPLNSTPGRVAGVIALQNHEYAVAQQRFHQSISREPQGWFSWLGEGLAASALGEKAIAHHDYVVAVSLNSRQPAVTEALKRVYTSHPLTPTQAFSMLVYAS
jgi:O-Antigen ligase